MSLPSDSSEISPTGTPWHRTAKAGVPDRCAGAAEGAVGAVLQEGEGSTEGVALFDQAGVFAGEGGGGCAEGWEWLVDGLGERKR
jgi:hypothetical protein